MDDKDLLIQNLRRELAAAKSDLYFTQCCRTCKNYSTELDPKICEGCSRKSTYIFRSKWEWRGVCAGNTPSLRRKENE